MLKFLILFASLVGLSVSSVLLPHVGDVPDPVPDHTAVGGSGEFVHDPVGISGARNVIRDVVPSPNANVIVHDSTHDVVPGLGSNSVVRDVTHDVVPGPVSNSVVHDVTHDVVPGLGSNAFVRDVTHDVVPSQVSNAVVRDATHDVIPGPGVVHDVVPSAQAFAGNMVHDVVPQSSNVVHDVVPAASAVVPSRAAVRDVVSAAHVVTPDFPKLPKASFSNPFGRSDNGIGTSLVAPSARYANPAALKCGLKPEPFIAYQLSRFSYNYPKDDIHSELQQRPEIRSAVSALATRGRFGAKYVHSPTLYLNSHRNKRAAGISGGCVGEALTLRTFHAYNNYCWLLNPVYQDVTFYNCYQSCTYSGNYGSVNRCEATYVNKNVMSYCAGRPYGQRIGYVSVPIPTSCSCKTYKCS